MTDGNTNVPANNETRQDGAPLAARILMSLAVLALVSTYVATQVDFIRRHRPGIAPSAYLQPQAVQILAPGLGLAAALGTAAALVRRGARRQTDQPLGQVGPTD